MPVIDMDISYTAFTHLLDGEGQIWGQKDGIPARGQLPTTSWVEGEIIQDEYEIEAGAEAPAGEYVLETGMYEWETGTRLPAFDEHSMLEGDRVLPTRVNILP